MANSIKTDPLKNAGLSNEIMTDEQLQAFLLSLATMHGHSDTKNINANYKRILAAGFRCNRKSGYYVHPSGKAITWQYINNAFGDFRWIEVK